jgi:tetratricopeptide (TPR) repeat protein
VNRDLVFFVAGLSFGIVAGFFVFRALVPASGASGSTAAAVATPSAERSQIGLEREPEAAPLDEDAVDRLQARANDNPDDAAVRAELGKLYLDAGRYQDAGAWLTSALELEPDNLNVRTQLALSLLNVGRLDDAVAAYEENLRVAPEHPASLLGLGRVKLYLQQDIDGGLALWEKLVAVAPGSAEAQSVRDELEALKSAHPGG